MLAERIGFEPMRPVRVGHVLAGRHNTKLCQRSIKLAEVVGFEPTGNLTAPLSFQDSTIVHSVILP